MNSQRRNQTHNPAFVKGASDNRPMGAALKLPAYEHFLRNRFVVEGMKGRGGKSVKEEIRASLRRLLQGTNG
jgi:hypothetical protein